MHGVVLDEAQTNTLQERLTTAEDMKKFFGGKRYDVQRVDRTLFVPSDRFTRYFWDFTYSPENLERMIDLE